MPVNSVVKCPDGITIASPVTLEMLGLNNSGFMTSSLEVPEYGELELVRQHNCELWVNGKKDVCICVCVHGAAKGRLY